MVIPGKLQVKWPAFLVFDAPGYRPVALSLTGMAALTAAWVLLWPVPTEVVGTGGVSGPGESTLLDAWAAGNYRYLSQCTGELVG